MTAEPRVEELLATIRKAIDHDISELDKRGAVLKAPGRAPHAAPQKPDADQDIAHLRTRVSRQRTDAPMVTTPSPTFAAIAPKLEPRNNGVSAILSGAQSDFNDPLPPAAILRPSYGAEEAPRRDVRTPLTRMEPPRFMPLPDPVPYHPPPRRAAPPPREQVYHQPPQDVTWVEEQPYQPPPEHYYAQQPPAGALMSPDSAYAAQASFQALANSLVAQMGGDGRLQDLARDTLQPLLKEWLDDNLPQLVEKLVREEIERVARRGR